MEVGARIPTCSALKLLLPILSKALWGEARGPVMWFAAHAGPHGHLLCGVGPVADMSKALRGQGVLIHSSLLSSLRLWRR